MVTATRIKIEYMKGLEPRSVRIWLSDVSIRCTLWCHLLSIYLWNSPEVKSPAMSMMHAVLFFVATILRCGRSAEINLDSCFYWIFVECVNFPVLSIFYWTVLLFWMVFSLTIDSMRLLAYGYSAYHVQNGSDKYWG